MAAAENVPERIRLPSLRKAAADCRGCELWRTATRTVFGEGAKRSEVMLVGEQPGDREDREGRPFVGPAGRLLDEALEEPGSTRSARTSRTSSSTSSGRRYPSAILRAHAEDRERERAAFVADLEVAASLLQA